VDDFEDMFDWAHVYKRLLGYAVRKLGRDRIADAEEIVQEALRQLFDPENKDWVPPDGDGLDELLRDLGSRVNGLISNYWKKHARRGDSIGLDRDHAGNSASPEDRVVNADHVEFAVSTILDQVVEDEVAVEVLFKMAEGIRYAADIAEALGIEARDVYNARRRLAPHIDAVKAQLAGETT